MRIQNRVSLTAFFLAVSVFSYADQSNAQGLRPLNTPSTPQVQPNPGAVEPDSQTPFRVSSRFHVEQGSTTGYLVVKVEMAKGSYIYSMTQPAPMRAAKITVSPSNQFRIIGKFAPDKPATVVEFDPIFEQRVEKHKGSIQFFVPIELAKGVEVATLTPELTFAGQVCTEDNICMAISDLKTKGKFGGYFERQAPTRTASQTPDNHGTRIR